MIGGFVGSGVVYAVSLEGVSDALYLSVSDPLCSISRPLDALKLLTFFLSPTLGLRSPAALGAVLAVCAGEVCQCVWWWWQGARELLLRHRGIPGLAPKAAAMISGL